jgi:hypothetical protein
MEMTIKMNDTNGIRIAATLVGCMCAAGASAQRAQLDTENLDPSVRAASCAAVNWNKDLLEQYPRLAEGCQEVLISDGRKWARFSADLIRTNGDGSVTLNFKDRQDRSMEQLTLMPAAAQRVSIDGRDYRFSELPRGQQLNLYVPEGMYALALMPGAASEQLAQIVPPTQTAQPAPTPRVAQAEPARASTLRQLPNTAGPLPLVALGGLMSLLGGLGLSLRRRFFVRK